MPLDEFKLIHTPEEYVTELETRYKTEPEDIKLIQELCELYLEVGEAEKAFPLINEALNLDPEGKTGAQKFFWAGQLIGGFQGLEFFRRGNDLLKSQMDADLANKDSYLQQISAGLLAMIEIWMTDLCMEHEAEKQCEMLVKEASLCTPGNPEVYSVLGSIRISQLRNSEAQENLRISWNLYFDLIENHKFEYEQLLQLLRLAQSMVELRMFEDVEEVCTCIIQLDDAIPEIYYLKALNHQLKLASLSDYEDRMAEREKCLDAIEGIQKLEQCDPEILEACLEIKCALEDSRH